MAHVVSWFDIPATDYERAVKFYEQIFNRPTYPVDLSGVTFAFLDHPANALTQMSGAIVKSTDYPSEPSGKGVIVYLNGGEDLSAVLEKVEEAGGKILTPKTEIGNNFGYSALFQDTEGNKIGLYSPN